MKTTITVMGGDARQAALAAYFARRGALVRCFGVPYSDTNTDLMSFCEWREALLGATAVILPLPATHDSRHLYMQGGEMLRAPRLQDVLEVLPVGTFLAGGRMSEGLLSLAREKGLRAFDYFKCEALQEANALPTAEGAVSILMQELPRTVAGLSVLVTGFGRVGKALVRLLLAMGALVTVAARRSEVLSEAAALGCATLDLRVKDALADPDGRFAAIFNTVPERLLDDECLARLSSETLLIDLASSPGGIDAEAASFRGFRTIWALSLPGKYAPVTAGEMIGAVVEDALKREGIL
ncbi:MAG: dipicolinate synthase [Clostridia bacterium]|nr:dipicolinate synthase [Clostridia bacterium]